MDIQHIHLEQTSSTQSVLKEHLKSIHSLGNVLISTDHQVSGVGRRGHSWSHFEHALAFSFTLRPSKTITLTPLEIGLHVVKFFSPSASLKWPNDILNKKSEKAGGIICQLLNDMILVGIGINLKVPQINNNEFPYPVGGLFSHDEELKENIKKELPLKLYQSILENRYSDKGIIKDWSKHCIHQNRHVSIQDGKTIHSGFFTGITSHGEAVIRLENGETKNILTGSLRF